MKTPAFASLIAFSNLQSSEVKSPTSFRETIISEMKHCNDSLNLQNNLDKIIEPIE